MTEGRRSARVATRRSDVLALNVQLTRAGLVRRYVLTRLSALHG